MAQINEWLTIDKTSGTGNAEVTLTASSYEELVDRSASLSIKTHSKEVIMNVIQKAYIENVWIRTNLISSEWQGGTFTTEISSIYDTLYCETTESWLTASIGEVNGKRIVTIVIEQNLTDEIRRGWVVLKNEADVQVGIIKVGQNIERYENFVIFYTTTNGSALSLSSAEVFENEYTKGIGHVRVSTFYPNNIKVPYELFKYKEKLLSVSLSPSIYIIDDGAFMGCSNLSSINLENITDIRLDGFMSCSSLSNVELPSIEHLGDGAFQNAHLKYIKLNENLTDIGIYSFCDNDFTEFVIPNSCTTVGEMAFAHNNNLKRVIFSPNMTSIPQNIFYESRSIETITIPSNIVYIDKWVFAKTNIKNIYIEDRENILDINGDAMDTTGVLSNIYVPNIKTWLLVKAGGLTKPVDGIKGIDYLYVNGELLTDVVIENDLELDIQPYAFYNLKHIRNVYLKSASTIGDYAFSNCTSLQEITIPCLPYTIGSYVFQGCSNLKNIKMYKLPFEGGKKETHTGFATITGSYNTGIVPNGDTRLEFWYKNDGTFSQYNNVIGSQQGGVTDGIFKIIEWGTNQYKLEYDKFSCTFTMDEGWHHIVVSKSEGLVVDDVVQASLSNVTFKNTNTPFYINSNYYENKKANGTFGKIIIDDHIIVPTEYGFYDTTLEMFSAVVDNGSYEFESDGGGTIIVNLVFVSSVPKITNNTFKGVSEYGFLEYPIDVDFSSWLSTSSYYLGYYKWTGSPTS